MFHWYVSRDTELCEHRRVTVTVNANSGDVQSYNGQTRGYTSYEPGYRPHIAYDEAVAILKSHVLEFGIRVGFVENKIEEDLDYEIVGVCYKPKSAESKRIADGQGWIWRAYIGRIGGISVTRIFIDSETGEILFSDLAQRN